MEENMHMEQPGSFRSIVDELRQASTDSPDRPFLTAKDGNLTFAAAYAMVQSVARHLVDAGVQAGDRVAIRLPNGVEWVITWLAILQSRAVAVPTNIAYQVTDLEFVLRDSGSSVIVTEGSSNEVVRETGPYRDSQLKVLDVRSLFTNGGATADPGVTSAIEGSALANLQYTSGTTGFPKACVLTHAYWRGLADTAARVTAANPTDVVLTAQPFSYIDPQWNVAMCLVARAHLVIEERFSASRFWQWVRQHEVTLFYVLGAMPTLLFKQPPSNEDRNNKVRLVVCSGIPARLHAALEERWGAPWREAFGMTESGIDTFVPLERADMVGSGSIGWPVEGKQIRVVDSEGETLPPGETGEMLIRGFPLMDGYWNRPEANAQVLTDGWFHTGDLVQQSPSGELRLVGRLKDMIRRGGENIAAVEVESAANNHPAVRASAAVGVPDELWGEEMKLVVQCQPGAQPSRALADEIIAHLTAELARFKVPRYVHFVEEFEMTPSERIRKDAIPARTAPSGLNIFDVGE